MNKLKLVFVFATCTLFAQQAQAQITVGAKAGVNINQFSQPGSVFGTNFGAFGKYKIIDLVSVRAELLYNQQGGARQDYFRDYSYIDGNVNGIEYTNRYVKLHNLEIPVLAEISHPSFSDEVIAPRLIAGFAYGINLGARETHEKTYFFTDGATSQIMLSDKSENVRSNYKLNQFGWILGFAVDMKAGDHTATIEVRYRRSLNQLNNIRFGTPDLDGLPGTIGQEGDLYSSSLSINFAMTIFDF